MKEDILKIIIDNSGTKLRDMVMLNPKDVSVKIADFIEGFITWQNSNDLEYYSLEKRYELWKNSK